MTQAILNEASLNVAIDRTYEIVKMILSHIPGSSTSDQIKARRDILRRVEKLEIDEECEIDLGYIGIQLVVYKDDINEVDLRFYGDNKKITSIRNTITELLS